MTGELTFGELIERLAQPVTDQHLTTAGAVRGDCFRCGCLRVIRAQKIGEMDISFHPCAEHAKRFEGVTVL